MKRGEPYIHIYKPTRTHRAFIYEHVQKTFPSAAIDCYTVTQIIGVRVTMVASETGSAPVDGAKLDADTLPPRQTLDNVSAEGSKQSLTAAGVANASAQAEQQKNTER